VFRRKSDSADAGSAAPDSAGSTGTTTKGRPTPSRKEAEAARKQRAKPVLDKRAAAKASRQASVAERAKGRQALAAGDERYLSSRDRGPVRRFARDYVDARRSIGEYMLPLVFLFLLVSFFVQSTTIKGYAIIGFYLVMISVIATTWFMTRGLRKAAEAMFPDESTKGLALYGAMRALQLRRLRMPKPKVTPGISSPKS
jgi:Protein of unknown function (DUF3043)